jgi:adenine-specific DNA-methyltransferase
MFSRRDDPQMQSLIDALGSPYHGTDECLIYNMDCTVGMGLLQKVANCAIFDLVVTSPPYNIGKRTFSSNSKKGKEYETPMSIDQYVDWCAKWIAQVHDLTKQRGAFWLNLGYVPVPDKGKAIPLPYLLYNRVPFFLNQEIVWNYGAGVSCKKQFSPRNEKFLWYVKDESHYTFNLDDVRDPNVKYPSQKKDGMASFYQCNRKAAV